MARPDRRWFSGPTSVGPLFLWGMVLASSVALELPFKRNPQLSRRLLMLKPIGGGGGLARAECGCVVDPHRSAVYEGPKLLPHLTLFRVAWCEACRAKVTRVRAPRCR